MSGNASGFGIDAMVERLRFASVLRVDVFEEKLTQNAGEMTVVRDLLAEGAAALMFASGGFQVEMSDCPDLLLEYSGQSIGAEVKHFRLKRQDEIDEARLAGVGDYLVEFGDALPIEGTTAWDQVADVAKRKAPQQRGDCPNLLVILSSSIGCIDGSAAMTAADVLNVAPARRACPQLSRLNGLMLMSAEFRFASQRSVHFFDLSPSNLELLSDARAALGGIREWA